MRCDVDAHLAPVEITLLDPNLVAQTRDVGDGDADSTVLERLQERGPDPKVHEALRRILKDNPDVTRKLRAMWALHVTDGFSEAALCRI